MARFTRTPPTPRRPMVDTITNLVAVGMVLIVGWLAWPMFVAEFTARTGITTITTAPPTLPTAAVTLPARPSAPLSAPLAVPALPGVAQNAATAQALYDAAVEAGEPQPNTNLTNDPAPVVVQSKPVERMPAGENVPTSEPIQPAESGGIFGSKPVLINPQVDQQCKHGQVWTERGCKNPTPIGGG